MSRPSSSRLSHRHHQRPPSSSRLRRPASAAPCLLYLDDDVDDDAAMMMMMLGEEEGGLSPLPHPPPPRPHTSFHYYPEELEGDEGGCQLMEVDYGHVSDREEWSRPEDPEPLKLAKKYGYGYRKPDTDTSPHWSQWPQPPAVPRPPKSSFHHSVTVTPPQSAYSYKNPYTVQPSVYDPVINNTHNKGAMTSRMRYNDERNVIMHRGLSPRRAAPPVMPGRSLTHYGGFGHRDYIGSLDLSAPAAYNPNRGFNPIVPSRGSSRESRPMHRHLRTARQEDGYLHNNSIYYSTTPNVSGYFIIHPDWVSERLSMRRSQSLLGF